MSKPKVLVFAGYGLNCEEETAYAFNLAGGSADIVHVNDLIDGLISLDDYHILAFPGGFAYGDDTGSGNAFALRIRNHLSRNLEDFLKKDRLIIGICNGCQILINLGLLPAIHNQYGIRQAALLPNSTARYTVRWVDLKVENNSPWLKGIDSLMVPIAHGEGKFYADKKVLALLKKNKQIAVHYIKGEICRYQNFPVNPTGTLEDIAGISDESGRILGIMPHPERAVRFTHLPHWTYLKEKYKREGKKIPTHGPGLAIFQNAIRYFQ